MVLGLQGPGRVGRRRSFITKSRPLRRLFVVNGPSGRHHRSPAPRPAGTRRVHTPALEAINARPEAVALPQRRRPVHAARRPPRQSERFAAHWAALRLRPLGRDRRAPPATTIGFVGLVHPLWFPGPRRTRSRSAGACTRTPGATATPPRPASAALAAAPTHLGLDAHHRRHRPGQHPVDRRRRRASGMSYEARAPAPAAPGRRRRSTRAPRRSRLGASRRRSTRCIDARWPVRAEPPVARRVARRGSVTTVERSPSRARRRRVERRRRRSRS